MNNIFASEKSAQYEVIDSYTFITKFCSFYKFRQITREAGNRYIKDAGDLCLIKVGVVIYNS